MTQPQLEQRTHQPLLETVIVEMEVNAEGRPVINVRGSNLQAPPEALWERIIVLLRSSGASCWSQGWACGWRW